MWSSFYYIIISFYHRDLIFSTAAYLVIGTLEDILLNWFTLNVSAQSIATRGPLRGQITTPL